MRKYVLFILVLGGLTSCSYMESLSPQDGEIMQEVITVTNFSNIVVDASYRIVFANSDVPSVKMEGLDYLLKDMNCYQEGGTLFLNHDRRPLLGKDRLITVTLSSPGSKNITINEPCQLHTKDTYKTESLRIITNGSGAFTEAVLDLDINNFSLTCYGLTNMGNYTFRGKAQNCSYRIEGGVIVDARELQTESTHLNHRSMADIFINASNKATIRMYSQGNAYYCCDNKEGLNIEYVSHPYFNGTGKAYSID